MSSRLRIDIHRGRGRTISRRLSSLVLSVVAVAGCGHVPGLYTYEGKNGATAGGGAAAFNAQSYVQGIFASKIVPTVHAKAVDAGTLLPAITADATAAGKKYGTQSGVGSPYSYLIKGTGTVTKYDDSDPTGPVTVKLAGGQTVTITTGPVLIGTALRDAVGFIAFSQFTNQIDFLDVATQINAMVKTTVLAKIDKAKLTGKKVSFEGAFSLLDPTSIVIIPTVLTVAG